MRSWKDRAIDIGYIAATMVALGTLHSVFALPHILREAGKQAREELDRRMTDHQGIVDERFGIISRRLDTLATKEGLDGVKVRLDSIDERLRHLERDK